MRPVTACHTVNGKRYLSRRALKQLGWFPFIVSQHMPKPDLVVPNPFRPGEPMPLYSEKRVLGLEARYFTRFPDGGILVHLPPIRRSNK